jgi:hypothetical protein
MQAENHRKLFHVKPNWRYDAWVNTTLHDVMGAKHLCLATVLFIANSAFAAESR